MDLQHSLKTLQRIQGDRMIQRDTKSLDLAEYEGSPGVQATWGKHDGLSRRILTVAVELHIG